MAASRKKRAAKKKAVKKRAVTKRSRASTAVRPKDDAWRKLVERAVLQGETEAADDRPHPRRKSK